jgi:dUTPase
MINKKEILIHLCPGAKLPQASNGARGYDAFLYEILHPDTFEPLWDFQNNPPALIEANVDFKKVGPANSTQPVYVLRPKEIVRVGFGFHLGMTEGWCAMIANKSSMAGKRIIPFSMPPSSRELNASPIEELAGIVDYYLGVPIDWDFRGRPTTLLLNDSDKDVIFSRGQKITQLCFQGPDNIQRPEFKIVGTVAELGETKRGNGSHASTGTH